MCFFFCFFWRLYSYFCHWFLFRMSQVSLTLLYPSCLSRKRGFETVYAVFWWIKIWRADSWRLKECVPAMIYSVQGVVVVFLLLSILILSSISISCLSFPLPLCLAIHLFSFSFALHYRPRALRSFLTNTRKIEKKKKKKSKKKKDKEKEKNAKEKEKMIKKKKKRIKKKKKKW